jgi:uncharacterized protein
MTDNSAGGGSAEDMGLESILDDILDDGQSTAPEGEVVSEDEIAGLLGEKVREPAAAEGEGEAEPEPDSEDMTQEEMTGLMGDVYSGGRRLERIGDCVLTVSDDGMKASFRGRLPEKTTLKEALQILERNEIRFGVIQSRIYDALPQKKGKRRSGREKKSMDEGTGEVVVAEGQEPTPPREAYTEYHFKEVGEEVVGTVVKILEGFNLGEVQKCDVPLSLVGPGQLLAEVIRDSGEVGWDVFGSEIAVEVPTDVQLRAGENVALEEEGRCCVARACGYAGVIDGAVAVIPPLWVSRDLLRVSFVLLPQEGEFPVPSAKQIKKMVEGAGVEHGVLEEEIGALCAKMKKGEKVERMTQIARGTEAIPGKNAEWKFVCDPDYTRYFGEILRIFTRSRNVEYLEEYSKGLAAKMVSADERLAVKQPPAPGEMGMDVFGEEFTPDEPEDVVLEGSEHIRFDEEGEACFAEIFGYIGIGKQGDRVQIFSPVWVAPDRMGAYFVNLPQLGEKRAPKPEEVDRLLELAEVEWGIDQQAIGLLCEKMKQGLPTGITVPIARGEEQRDGEDGWFDFAVERDPQPGFFAEDGSIDFKQLNLTPLLAEGALIGRKMSATEGRAGIEVSGRELPAKDGEEVVIDLGKNVRLVRKEGEPDAYHSEVEGELVAIERMAELTPMVHIEMHRVMTVQGDVDYHTGNIDFPGSVHVEGSIQSGFEVKGEGNVVVGNSIEEGAVVVAGGNVAVKHGILGEKTKVTAGGSVFVKFINEATVRAKVDMNISEYAFNGSLRVGEELKIWGTTGNRPSGVIAGGTAIVGEKVTAFEVGTDGSAPTQLVVGVDASMLREAAQLQELIDQYNGVIGKSLRALQVERMPAEQIRNILLNLVLKAKGERRKMLARSVKNLLELQSRLGTAMEKKKKLDERMEEMAMRGAVEVEGTVAVNTLIKIGRHALKIEGGATEVIETRFALGKDKRGKIRLLMSAS